jgi:hypothetical protein
MVAHVFVASRVRMSVAILSLIAIIGCGSNANPAAPSATAVAGTWSAPGLTIQIRVAPIGPNLNSNQNLTGTWMLGASGASSASGSVAGLATATTMNLVLTPEVSLGCPMNIGGNLDASATRLTGTYTTSSNLCSGGYTFPITLSKQ